MISPDGDIVHPARPEDDRGSDVLQLPHRPALPRHAFGAPLFVPQDPSRDAHPQTERICANCGLVKVTVHGPGGDAWREWRESYASPQYRLDAAPSCMPLRTGTP